MRTLRTPTSILLTLPVVALIASTLPSCEEPKGPAEKIGEAIDDATDNRPGEGVRDALEDAADAVRNP